MNRPLTIKGTGKTAGMFFGSIVERFRDWQDRRVAMKELREIKREEEPYIAHEISASIVAIKAAAFQGDPDAAVKAWRILQGRAPDLAITSMTVLRSLMSLELFDMADELLVEAMGKYPGALELMELYAEVGLRRGEPEEANRRWEMVRKAAPGHVRAWIFNAVCLKDLKRYDEADALLERATSLQPEDPMAASEYAKVADERGDVEEALRRWEQMRERQDDLTSWVECAVRLRALGRETEAVALLEKAQWRYLSSARPSIELARMTLDKGDIEGALRQWATMRSGYPQEPMGYIAAAHVLRNQGKQEEAEEILLGAVERITLVSEPTVEYARFAHGRDWPEAVQRWAMVRDRFPERVEGYTWGGDALEAAGQPEEAARVRAAKP